MVIDTVRFGPRPCKRVVTAGRPPNVAGFPPVGAQRWHLERLFKQHFGGGGDVLVRFIRVRERNESSSSSRTLSTLEIGTYRALNAALVAVFVCWSHLPSFVAGVPHCVVFFFCLFRSCTPPLFGFRNLSVCRACFRFSLSRPVNTWLLAMLRMFFPSGVFSLPMISAATTHSCECSDCCLPVSYTVAQV